MQALGRHRLAQLLERPRLELAHALAREAERLPDLLERVLLLAAEAVAQAQDQLLARGEGADQVPDPGAHALRVESQVGRRRGRVRDEVLEALLGARDRRLERDRLPREQVEDLERARVGAELGGELRGRRLAPELARQLGAHALAALEPVVDVRRQPDRARVILDRAHERLADPPDRVGRELEAAPVVELLDRADQAQVALLDQVREGESEVPVVLRDRDHELQVVLDEAVLLAGQPDVRLLDALDQLQEPQARDLDLALELLVAARAAPGPLELARDLQHALPQLREHREREVRLLELADDARVDALELLGVVAHLLALRAQGADALHGAGDALGDLARLLGADRLRELRAGVRERAQVVPALDDVARAEGDRVERVAQVGRRRLELLGEEDLLLAAQRPRAADLLEVRFQRPPLAAGIELVRRHRASRTGRAVRRRVAARGLLRVLELQIDHPRAPDVIPTHGSDTARGAPVSDVWLPATCPLPTILDLPAAWRALPRGAPRRPGTNDARAETTSAAGCVGGLPDSLV